MWALGSVNLIHKRKSWTAAISLNYCYTLGTQSTCQSAPKGTRGPLGFRKQVRASTVIPTTVQRKAMHHGLAPYRKHTGSECGAKGGWQLGTALQTICGGEKKKN